MDNINVHIPVSFDCTNPNLCKFIINMIAVMFLSA